MDSSFVVLWSAGSAGRSIASYLWLCFPDRFQCWGMIFFNSTSWWAIWLTLDWSYKANDVDQPAFHLGMALPLSTWVPAVLDTSRFEGDHTIEASIMWIQKIKCVAALLVAMIAYSQTLNPSLYTLRSTINTITGCTYGNWMERLLNDFPNFSS